MVGRLAMNNTWEMAKIDNTFFPEFGSHETPNREQLLLEYADYAQ